MEKMSIKAVAEITGITEFTLRAWENRYRALEPERNEVGRRLYTLKDVEKLRLLHQLRLRGHAIKDIASLDITKLTRLFEQTSEQSEGRQQAFVPDRTPESHVLHLIQCMKDLDLPLFMSSLKRAHLEFDTRTYMIEVLSPFLQVLGKLVQEGELDVFHEHTASAVIRNSLTGLLYSAEQFTSFKEEAPLIFCTPEGDLHEFGILICAVLAILNGFKVFYLGPNTPRESLLKATMISDSPLVVLGISAPRGVFAAPQLRSYVENLRRELPVTTHLWVGGSRVPELNPRHFHERFRKIEALKNFDRSLRLWRSQPQA